MEFTHLNSDGAAYMVDVTEKQPTVRTATAEGEVACSPEVMTALRDGTVPKGDVLAVARIAGETAPLLFTALNNQFFTADLNQPMANLPVVIYRFAMSPYDDWQSIAWGAALLVTLSVLLLNILSRTAFRQKTPQ